MEESGSDSEDYVTEVAENIKEEKMSSCSDNESENEMLEKNEEAQETNSQDKKNEEPKIAIKISFACNFCSIEYNEQEELESHLSNFHQPPNPYTCAFCTMTCANSITLSLHTKIAHKPRARALAKPFSSPLLKCEICGNMFADSKDLLSHQHKQHHKCLVCLELCSTYTILRAHMKKEHSTGTSEKPPREKMPKPCPYCKKMFTDSFNLKTHIRKHTGEKPFECGVCGKKLSNPSNFKRHVEFHSNGERPFQCEICNKSFRFAQKLSNHEKLHFGGKPWICEICGKGFVDASTLRKHKKIHTRITFLCDECPREFLTEEKLEIHKLRKHEVDGDTKKLKLHEKTQENDDEDRDQAHECDYCGEIFNTLRLMKQHEKIHTFAEYTCDHCGESYTLERSLKLHLKIKHSELEDQDTELGGRSVIKHKKTDTEKFSCVDCGKSYCHLRSLKKHARNLHNVLDDDEEDSS